MRFLTKHRLSCIVNDGFLKLFFKGWLCIIGMLPLALRAQGTAFVQPAARLITRFHFTQFTGGIILVQARLDNIGDTLNFILDTGCGGISLDSATVEEFHIPTRKSDHTIRGIAGMKLVDFAYNHTLRLPGLNVDSLNFHVNDYDLLSSVYGVKIDGIIGFSFLRHYIIEINYDSLQIGIYTPGNFKYPRGGHMLYPTFTSLAMPDAVLTDEKQIASRYIFDTGAGLCLLLSEDFVKDSSVIKSSRKLLATQAEGLGGKKPMQLTVLKHFQLGPYKFRQVPTLIFDDDFNVTNYPVTGGLVGNDILRRFNVVLNYPEQSIFIKPNSHFADIFDYSYTGLGIYQTGKNTFVMDIIPDSPGAKAGFKLGDQIVAIDNNINSNIQVFKYMLQSTGANLKVVVLRDGTLHTLSLKVRNILRG